MKKNILTLLLATLVVYGFSQQNIILSFTGVHNTTHAQLDSIKILNRIHNCDTVLFWPDTVLDLSNVGIMDLDSPENKLIVFQNSPNPAAHNTNVSVYSPKKQHVKISITDINGKLCIANSYFLDRGTHKFRFFIGNNNMYLFTASCGIQKSSIKIISAGSSNRQSPFLEYSGMHNTQTQYKASNNEHAFIFNPGDDLLVKGFYEYLESGIMSSPLTSRDFVFQFAYNIPCPGNPTVDYGGKVYSTVQIFNQCWLKQNLDIGEMIMGNQEMQDNETIEKYCYNNDPSNCNLYGGLYQWDEIMKYSDSLNNQGICPDGWHIPGDSEWKILEGSTDEIYSMGDPEWDDLGFNGFDVGKNLKSTSGWNSAGNGTDLYGFGAIGGGSRDLGGTFSSQNSSGVWWSSSDYSNDRSFQRMLSYNNDHIQREIMYKSNAYSVRCVMEYDGVSPVANLSGDPTVGTAPLTVTFTDETINNPTSWHWDFGDGNTSPEQNPEHIYQDTGLYTVMLTVSNKYGTDTLSKTDYIVVFQEGGVSCPSMESIEYGGLEYSTVLIGEQCWLKQNLNIGEMISGTSNMMDNGIIEKYCYDDNPENCNLYGAMYQWDEVMQYTIQEGIQGICPEGWHIPDDNEWKILEGTVDSSYPVNDPEWDNLGWRGVDVGNNLKSTLFWNNAGNGLDAFGFTALPGGRKDPDGAFVDIGNRSHIWSSTEQSFEHALYRSLIFDYDNSLRTGSYKTRGLHVRCVNDVYYASPKAGFNALPITGVAPITVNFTDQSTNNPTSWHWDFGDGNTSSEQNPEHTYQDIGSYTIALVVANNFGSDTLIKADYIMATPEAGSPCPGMETIEYGGLEYNTVLVGEQCWLKQNLNIGEMISSTSTMMDNGIIEKYCYDDNTENCNLYGAMYQWDEAMQYTIQEGVQGICPEGWHIPDDNEWKILEGTVDSSYPVNDPEWDNMGFRGVDAGKNLKSTFLWNNAGNGLDAFGFTALPGGRKEPDGAFVEIGNISHIWSSSEQSYSHAIYRSLFFDYENSGRTGSYKTRGLYVRCLRDE